MVERKTFGDRVADFIIYFLLASLSIVCLYPMLHVLFASFSEPLTLMKHQGLLFRPLGFTTDGYKVVLNNPNIITGYINTIYYVVVGTAVNMILTVMGAYALSRPGYPFRKTCTFMVLLTMYFSGGIIPNYLLVRGLGLFNTRGAIIIPSAVATWNLIVTKTVFQNVPASLEESAKIDGANDFVILYKIFIPISTATMAVMTLFYAVSRWNAWFNAMLYLQNRDLFPLQLFLREILIAAVAGGNIATESGSDTINFLADVIRYATIVIATVPILLIYPFAQRFFIKGVMMGSLKE